MSFFKRFDKKPPLPVVLIVSAVALLIAVYLASTFYVGLSKNSAIVFEEIPDFYQNSAFLDGAAELEKTVHNGSQVKVNIGRTVFNWLIRLNLKGANEYTISYFLNGDFKASQTVNVSSNDFQVKEYGYLIEVPAPAVASGYDQLVVTPHFQFGLKLSLEDKDTVDVSLGQEEINIAEFIQRLPSDYYTLVAVKDEGSGALKSDTKRAFTSMGSEMAKLRHRGSYAGIFHQGEVLTEEIAHGQPVAIDGNEVESLNEALDKRNTTLKIESAGYESGNYGRIFVNGKNLSPGSRGHNFVILDENFEPVNTINVDTFATDRITDYDSYRLFATQYKNASLGETMEAIPPEFTVLITTKGDYAGNISDSTEAWFERAGSKIFDTGRDQSYVGFFRNGEVLTEKLGDGRQALSGFEVDRLQDELVNANRQITALASVGDEPASIFIDGEAESYNSPGIQVLVLSEQLETLLTYTFDAEDGDKKALVTVLQKQSPPPERIETTTSASSEEKLRVRIPEETYQELFDMRGESIRLGGVKDAAKAEFTGEIEYQGTTYGADMRFKGDWLDHVESERWSYRVNLHGGETIKGMERFSIQGPETRSHIYEWVVHQIYRNEGGIAPRYDFVPVDVNNKGFGVYALEEHFAERMLEFHDRKEGPILKYEEWRPFNSPDVFPDVLPDNIPFENYWRSIENTEIGIFQENNTRENEQLRGNSRRAYALLDGFRKKQFSPGEVFDTDKYALLMAVSDLFHTWHSIRWHNLRFYYNPVTDKLEPILYDADAADRNYDVLSVVDPRDQISSHLFKDPDIRRAYFKYLEKFAREDYLNGFRREHADQLKHYRTLLSEHGQYAPVPWHMFNRRQQLMRNTLYGGDPLRATIKQVGEDKLRVSVSNSFQIPYEIGDLRIANNRYSRSSEPTLIEAEAQDRVYSFDIDRSKYTQSPAHLISLEFRVPGTEDWRSVSVLPYPEPSTEYSREDFIRNKSNIDQFDFISKDENGQLINIAPGTWTIRTDVYVPGGHRFNIAPGTTLDLQNGAKIISFSPINAVGSEDSPIIVKSSDQSSQGIAVLNTNEQPGEVSERSILKNVTFSGLSNPDEKGWVLPGSVSFYKSDLVVADCTFTDNNSEDALNIMSSRYTLSGSTFRNIFGDAFDADLSSGTVADNRFINTGQDAVEFSGGESTVNSITVKQAGGRGINATEGSTVTVDNIVIEGADVGIAARDRATISGKNVSIEETRVGAAAFQKKPEYGPASITIEDSYLDPGLSLPSISDEGSDIMVNGEELRIQRKKRQLLLDMISEDTQ